MKFWSNFYKIVVPNFTCITFKYNVDQKSASDAFENNNIRHDGLTMKYVGNCNISISINIKWSDMWELLQVWQRFDKQPICNINYSHEWQCERSYEFREEANDDTV